ncbi:hypothetical protein RhiirC2_797827 [Rhizophagus irregularis]|uniref:Uncharacterized protein n=1 Tax=Rhizophagus irregularis TaxID=588596 RepID=A0A2N1M7G4_9GLOM|nr:hypothetical protein RhiirC2_797827 [Rhizophagus irregularis]
MKKIDNKWIYVEERLYDELSLILELELKHIRFIIQPEEDNGEKSFANKFVERLVVLLWYIDPHREKLIARLLKLPDIFNELEQYQHNESYNKFYFTGHHKKEQLSHEKLEELVKSLELSIE